MSINLSKGSAINLSKEAPGLTNILVGLGWDPAKSGGLFKHTPSIDCDAFAVLLSNHSNKPAASDVVYFGNLRHSSGSVVHTGDNLTGDGDGDDEQILIYSDKIPKDVNRIVIGVNIYKGKNKNQTFGKIQNAFIRLVDRDKNIEVCRYNLSGSDYSEFVTMVFGELYREGNSWAFKATGEGNDAGSISEFIYRFR